MTPRASPGRGEAGETGPAGPGAGKAEGARRGVRSQVGAQDDPRGDPGRGDRDLTKHRVGKC